MDTSLQFIAETTFKDDELTGGEFLKEEFSSEMP
jgi:hypothetical protein